MGIIGNANWKNESWYENLDDSGKCLADLIHKSHDYFSKQDKKYRNLVRTLKITVLVLAMISTVVLGLKSLKTDTQVTVGLFLSAGVTLITAISSYFNFEEYWMRNISIHIQLNIIRDSFIMDVESKKLDSKRIEEYMKKLNEIQNNNIRYWQKAIKKI
ncbi:MAG: DUF4231 domain-containing protein [Clostridium lundense]|nr:DUF4231 domain-containing protein [Clostridium lundense]